MWMFGGVMLREREREVEGNGWDDDEGGRAEEVRKWIRLNYGDGESGKGGGMKRVQVMMESMDTEEERKEV